MKTFSLPFGLTGPPSACSSAADRIDVFAVGPGGVVWRVSGDGEIWAPPTPLPVPSIPASGLCAVVSGPGRAELFAVPAGGGSVAWCRGNGTAWTAGPALNAAPARIPSEPVAAVAASPDQIDVFAVGTDRNPWWSHWNGTFWLVPVVLPGAANLSAERIAAVSPSPGRLDVFAVGGNNGLWHWSKVGAGPWNLPEYLGGNMPSEGVSAVCWGAGRIDVFAASREAGNPLLHWWWAGGNFNGPESLGGSLASGTVSAVSHAPDRLDVFAISRDQRLAHWQWDGRGWTGPDFRGEGIPAGDVSAVLRKPHRLDVLFTGAGNTLRKWPGGGLENATTQPWTNWPTNHTVNPSGHLRPDSLDELVDIVKEAERLGRPVRAVGSSWSNSEVAVTPGYVVETDGLGAVLTDVLRTCLNPAGSAMRLMHVEAGIKLYRLIELLDARGLALKTLGGSTGQSLAGALSTSVHGMDIDRGPLPDMVRAIHLVGPGGTQHWIEPAGNPITTTESLQSVLGPNVTIHYDDNWFYSVLVSMGAMGIIYSLIVEVDQQYDLIETCQALDWTAMKARLAAPAGTPDSPFTNNRGVQIVLDPYPAGDGSRRCYLTTRTQAAATGPRNGPDIASLLGFFTPGLLASFRANPGMIPGTVNSLTNTQQAPGGPPKRGWAHTISGGRDPGPIRGLTVEVMFDATNTNYLQFVDAALEIIRSAYGEPNPLGYLGWISMRFQGQSKAYLSPQFNSARTCTIEFAAAWRMPDLPGVGWADTPVLLARIEALAKISGGIQHWGMNDSLDAAGVAHTYQRLNTWLQVRWELTQNGTVTTFDNDFTRRCGLTAQPFRRPMRPPRPL